jgi:ribosome-associated protein
VHILAQAAIFSIKSHPFNNKMPAAMPESEKQAPDEFSKTRRKKDMHALQDLGGRLTKYSESQLQKLPISEEMQELIRTAKKLKTHESIRRHMQYIGKKMRAEDAAAILAAIKKHRLP